MRIQYTQFSVHIAAGVASCWKRHGEAGAYSGSKPASPLDGERASSKYFLHFPFVAI